MTSPSPRYVGRVPSADLIHTGLAVDRAGEGVLHVSIAHNSSRALAENRLVIGTREVVERTRFLDCPDQHPIAVDVPLSVCIKCGASETISLCGKANGLLLGSH